MKVIWSKDNRFVCIKIIENCTKIRRAILLYILIYKPFKFTGKLVIFVV